MMNSEWKQPGQSGADPTEAVPFTPEATIGPFYPGVFVAQAPADLSVVAPLLTHRPQGQPLIFTGRFFDSLARPVPSLILEFWQANAHGRYRHPQDNSASPLDPQFEGFARLRTDADGAFRFATIKPGPHAVRQGSRLVRAPHLRLTIFASGIDRLITQVFFEDEPLNDCDPVLNSIADPVTRSRLIAKRQSAGQSAGVLAYALDFILRGDGETPFFDDWY
jgi:protocatechuate 3,4-dioxygenase beta subunit